MHQTTQNDDPPPAPSGPPGRPSRPGLLKRAFDAMVVAACAGTAGALSAQATAALWGYAAGR
ncbi:hypothetical protein [Kitasatospora aburaviensis]|uniref:Uncharacterized protein n=1 Tax=Kitasatospora aburaviensis TaxID=67265 RepID=A0ABW1F030_9ACTN